MERRSDVISREIDVIRGALLRCSDDGNSCSGCRYREFDDCFALLCYDAYVLIGELDENDCG